MLILLFFSKPNYKCLIVFLLGLNSKLIMVERILILIKLRHLQHKTPPKMSLNTFTWVLLLCGFDSLAAICKM